jgi:homocysteine S-methyltransferase
LTSRELFRFHRDRFEILADTEADLIACETIPSRREADVLVDLFERRGGRPGWISFTCRDERRIAEGDAFAESVASLSASAWVVLVGINCTAPELVEPLLESARDGSPKPFVVYPNSGETYQARTGTWIGVARSNQVGARNAERWHALGARLIGGCCRTGPDNVREIRGVFDSGAREARDDAR